MWSKARRLGLTFGLILGFLFSMLGTISVNAQNQTAGLFISDTLSQEGYTLFAPNKSTTTYMIDHYGRLVNKWESTRLVALSVYLLENGNLLRSAAPGGAQIFAWDGTLLWDFVYQDTNFHQHHDIEPLPNGNILMLVQGNPTWDDAVQAGRDTTQLDSRGLNKEFIVEIQPIGFDSGVVVWKWDLWDHLVQDFDPSKDNYGVVEDHPELLNINFDDNARREWVHANGIGYNADLDQIVISYRNTSEFYIIDHSTTTEEAAGHTGGNSGRGGDYLYRWGNPIAYGAGSVNDQRLFYQHNPHWIGAGLAGEGHILVFNNGDSRLGGSYSTVDEIVTPVDAFGQYTWPAPGSAFGPSNGIQVYKADNPADFYSAKISGAQRLPNGNTIICEGSKGHLFEVTPDGQIVWDYQSPIGKDEITVQGDTLITSAIFRTARYTSDYPGLAGKDLTPGAPLELYPFTLASTKHEPALPFETDPVAVTSTIIDDGTIDIANLMVDVGAGFTAIPMYDDGAHGDGAAGDDVYGAVIPAQPPGTLVRYYVYAEDNELNAILDPPSAQATTYRYRVTREGISHVELTQIWQQSNRHILSESASPTPGNPWTWTVSDYSGFTGTPDIWFEYQNAEQTEAEVHFGIGEPSHWLNGADGSFTLTLSNGVDSDRVYSIDLTLRALIGDGWVYFENQIAGGPFLNGVGAEGFSFQAANLSSELSSLSPSDIVLDEVGGIVSISNAPTGSVDGTLGLIISDGTRPAAYINSVQLSFRTLDPTPITIANDGLAGTQSISVPDDLNLGPWNWSGYIDGLPSSIIGAADVNNSPSFELSWLAGELQTTDTGTGTVTIQPADESAPLAVVSLPTSIIADGCCGTYTFSYTGNTDCGDDGKRNLVDITLLIDRVYISKTSLCCEENGNTNGDIEGKINLADITRLIDHVYITKAQTAICL